MLVSDGKPTDDWKESLEELLKSPRGLTADRWALAVRGALIVVSAMGLLLLLGLWMPVWFSGALGSAAAVLG